MKKIFTLITAALVVLAANAEIKPYVFTDGMGATAEDVAVSEVKLTIKDASEATLFTFKATDTNSTSKLKFKSSSAKMTVDGETYAQGTYRVEAGGAVSGKRVWTFTPAKSGKVWLMARNSGTGKTTPIHVKAGDTEVSSSEITDANTVAIGEVTAYKCPDGFNVTAGTEYTITTETNQIYLAGFYFEEGSSTGISEVATSAPANKAIKTANGIIKNGKKYNFAGQLMK